MNWLRPVSLDITRARGTGGGAKRFCRLELSASTCAVVIVNRNARKLLAIPKALHDAAQLFA